MRFCDGNEWVRLGSFRPFAGADPPRPAPSAPREYSRRPVRALVLIAGELGRAAGIGNFREFSGIRSASRFFCDLGLLCVAFSSARDRRALYLFRRAALSSRQMRSARRSNGETAEEIARRKVRKRGFTLPRALRIRRDDGSRPAGGGHLDRLGLPKRIGMVLESPVAQRRRKGWRSWPR